MTHIVQKLEGPKIYLDTVEGIEAGQRYSDDLNPPTYLPALTRCIEGVCMVKDRLMREAEIRSSSANTVVVIATV